MSSEQQQAVIDGFENLLATAGRVFGDDRRVSPEEFDRIIDALADGLIAAKNEKGGCHDD